MTQQREVAKRRERPTAKGVERRADAKATARRASGVAMATDLDDQANGKKGRGAAQALPKAAGAPHEHDDGGAQADRRPRGNRTLLRLLECAREQRGSPSLWDAVAARLDAEDRQHKVVAPMADLLHRIQERVDDTTWGLVLDFEMRFASEVMAGVEVGLELGYEHGRATALLDAERIPGSAAKALTGRLADLLGDTEADYLDVVLALLATLEATVKMARGGHGGREVRIVGAPRPSLP